ncbi:MAG: hypothetical protein JJT82_01905 [Legionellaceae bacterium]|nr:hypothetical protein [Legionellaceae bacterium]
MSEQLEKDIATIKEFVRQSAEFIAYFELVDSKIQEWQCSFETNLQHQQNHLQKQHSYLDKEIKLFEETLTQAGLARFRLQADKLLQQSEHHLKQVERFTSNGLQNLQAQQEQLQHFIRDALTKMDLHCQQGIQKIDQQLSRYDADHFRRIASDSCEQVERVAQHAIDKSNAAVRTLQWKTVLLTAAASLLTAFAIGLYVSDEWPWEMHQQAMNEREAGKILMKAWPKLTHAQRTTILHQENIPLG